VIAVDELGTELRWWEPPRAGTRQVVATDEVVTEVSIRWWEWLGVVFQYNMKWDKMARKLEVKGTSKVGVLVHYILFTGALSPSLALLVGGLNCAVDNTVRIAGMGASCAEWGSSRWTDIGNGKKGPR
jgi:hypothetical protein